MFVHWTMNRRDNRSRASRGSQSEHEAAVGALVERPPRGEGRSSGLAASFGGAYLHRAGAGGSDPERPEAMHKTGT